jgi:hypothetical protein
MSYALLSQRTATTANGGVLTSATSDNQFQDGAITTKDCDDSSIASLSVSQITLATGTYRIQAEVMFGYTPSLDGLHGRAILWSVTSSTVKTNKGTTSKIVGTPVVASDLGGARNGNAISHLMGRFEVTLPSEVFSIQMAGDALTGTWYNTSTAQGAPATAITASSYQNVYKNVEILKE